MKGQPHKFLLRLSTYPMLIILPILLLTSFCSRDIFYEFFSRYEGVEFCYIYNYEKAQNILLYSMSDSSKNDRIVKNGCYLFVYSNKQIFCNPKFKQGMISGDKEKYFEIIKMLNLKNIYTEKIGDIIATYGYSCGFGDFRYVNNHKINIQIVLSNEKILFGSPMIYGSY